MTPRFERLVKILREQYEDIINDSEKGNIEVNWGGATLNIGVRKNVQVEDK